MSLTEKLNRVPQEKKEFSPCQLLFDNIVIFVSICCLTCIFDLYYFSARAYPSFILSLLSDITFSYIITICIAYTKKRCKTVSNITYVIFHSIILIHGYLLLCSLITKHYPDYHDVFLIISETSKQEIIDFITFYGLFLLPFFCVIFTIVYFEYKLNTKYKILSYKSYTVKKTLANTLLFIMITMSSLVVFVLHLGFWGTLSYHLTFANENFRINKEISKYNKIGDVICDFKSSNIVLIIGESFNKYHSNIYGYEKVTNSRLSKEDNIHIFNDVISSNSITYSSFAYFLTSCRLEETAEWYKSTLFPCVFKKAGYNVLFWDNQIASCSYLSNSEIDCFSHKNKTMFKYDEGLIDDFKLHRSEIEKDSNNLVIFHLIGQHFDYDARYPNDRIVFKPDDYIYRKELNFLDRQTVADYDNAICYNDSIVCEIINMYKDGDAIIIYFSDHGEEIFDYRKFKGRTNVDLNNMSAWLHCNFDIPFIIYTSDLYREKHPDIVCKIEQYKNRPYELDDLPFFLYDIAGINGGYDNGKRSLISDSYDTYRMRYVARTFDDELINYDSICENKKSFKIGW